MSIDVKTFSESSDVNEPNNARVEAVVVGGQRVMRLTLQPGCRVRRITRCPPTTTASTRALLGELTSEDSAKVFTSIDIFLSVDSEY